MTYLLETIHALGWLVAIHNDYIQNDARHAFWLFTDDKGRYVKGEGLTDDKALQTCLDKIRALDDVS
jgi:hypothetical protein